MFVAMISFQLVGALILLVNSLLGSRKMVVQNSFPGSNVVERDENNKSIVAKEKLQSSAKKIYYNCAAFIDLIIGYAIAALSPVSGQSKLCTILSISGITVVLLIAEMFVCNFVAKKIYGEDLLVDYAELESYGVDTFATNKEIEDMVNDVFNK